MRSSNTTRGFTLVEVLIAISVLAMLSLIIYGAFSAMHNSREGVRRVGDRYREGRMAMRRITHELQSAYVSLHGPRDANLAAWRTAFKGEPGSPAHRVDFNAFVNRRLDRDRHESDQAEISYFGGEDPKRSGVTDLLRRVSSHLDMEPDRGGRVEVLATDIDLFDLSYLDATTGLWTERWDSTEALGQANRLPLQVRVSLVLNGGRRRDVGRSRQTIPFVTKLSLQMPLPLSFAIE